MWVRSKVRGREVAAVFLLEDSRVRFTFILVFFRRPFARCKGIQDILEFWIPRHGFRIPDSRYWNPDSLSVELGFRIPIVSGIPDSSSCIPDSQAQDSGFHSKFFHDSEFHKKKFRGLRGIQIPLHWATFLENNRNILVIKCEKYKQGKS